MVGGAEVAEVGVASGRAAEGFDPLEHRGAELVSGGPVLAVEELDLHGPEERFGHRVVETAAFDEQPTPPTWRCFDDPLNPV